MSCAGEPAEIRSGDGRLLGDAQVRDGVLIVWGLDGRALSAPAGADPAALALRLLRRLDNERRIPGTRCDWDGQRFVCQ